MKPIPESYEYLKFGFCKTRATRFLCPACRAVLNAGPNYQPRFCGECGQSVDFSGVTFPEPEFLGYEHKEVVA
jgi:hypothetical protein